MTAKIYYEKDVDDTGPAEIGIVGYGSQGRAHALNLRDSGHDVVVGLRKDSPSAVLARKDGFTVVTPGEACAGRQVVALLVPDQHQAAVYREWIEPALEDRSALLFAHGFNVHFGQIVPPPGTDALLVAPKAPGPVVRTRYETGRGVPALVAVQQDASGKAWQRVLQYAAGLGCTRAGAVETTFAEETETDLFGEQAVLCGGLSRLVQLGFETLVAAGYQPEIAYFECVHELKLIVDLLHDGGFTLMRQAVSDTAEYGDLTRGGRVVDDRVAETMRQILAEIRDGSFAREWILEAHSGAPVLGRGRDRERAMLVEEVGRALRRMGSQEGATR